MEYNSYRGRKRAARRLLTVLLALILAGAVSFLIPFITVLASGHDDVRGDPRIMVIFGCQLRESGPSTLLRDRLDTALA